MIPSPANITSLQPNEVFVFGANERGIHGAGAAKLALQWGAKMGQYGYMGRTYGIPTKDTNIKTLPLQVISRYIDNFLATAKINSFEIYLVTEIGCGLAGYTPEQIAPLFGRFHIPDNVRLPQRFIDILAK